MTEPATQKTNWGLILLLSVALICGTAYFGLDLYIKAMPKPAVAPFLPHPLLPHGRFIALRKGDRLVIIPDSLRSNRPAYSIDQLSNEPEAFVLDFAPGVFPKPHGSIGEEGP